MATSPREAPMEECLASSHLISVGRSWFGYARSVHICGGARDGPAAALREQFADPAYRERYQKFKAATGILIQKMRSCSTAPAADPEVARVRVYESDSVHKSMSCLRQGSL